MTKPTPCNPEPLLVDINMTAQLLGLSTRKVWSLTQTGAIPSHKIGRSVRYNPDQLNLWVQAGCPNAPGSARSLLNGGAA